MKMTYVVCQNDSPISATDNEDRAKTEVERLKKSDTPDDRIVYYYYREVPTLDISKRFINHEKVVSNIERQLWRYYNIDIDIEKIHRDTYNGVEFFNITGDSENSKILYTIKCKIYDSGTVEDLYLWDGAWIEPTTTLEEQEYR